MYNLSKNEFVRKAGRHNLVPLYREVVADTETPVSAFLKLKTDGYAFLLESAENGERFGRYSFLGTDPSLIISAKNGVVTIEDAGGNVLESRQTTDPLEAVKEVMSAYSPASIDGLPLFFGGAVGYISYDAVRYFENIPDDTKDDLDLPDMVFMLADTLFVFDHLKHRIAAVANAHVNGDAAAAYDLAAAKIEAMLSSLKAPGTEVKPLAFGPAGTAKKPASTFTEEGFRDIVATARERIIDGDILQVVLSQRFSTDVQAAAFDIYRSLRTVNPAPYMYYLSLKDFQIAGSSPEPLVRMEGDKVMTRPIAGTRSRGTDAGENARLEEELLGDAKEKAEHIMLVDLGRNDLGRVCRPGTVRVDEMMEIERCSHVMHMVSTVSGLMDKDKDAFDALRACFPAGTVSGAPKVRAMEIIDELEPTRRGPYAGAVGYFGYAGNLDTCITIRTIVVKDNRAYFQAGAGIVYDSEPSFEYRETGHKARALLEAIAMAEAASCT
jgi:anthranilate synthase component 1